MPKLRNTFVDQQLLSIVETKSVGPIKPFKLLSNQFDDLRHSPNRKYGSILGPRKVQSTHI